MNNIKAAEESLVKSFVCHSGPACGSPARFTFGNDNRFSKPGNLFVFTSAFCLQMWFISTGFL